MKNIDWKNLSFGYVKTDYNVRCYFRNGEWGKLELSSDEYIPMHMAASCLHDGQEAFARLGLDGIAVDEYLHGNLPKGMCISPKSRIKWARSASSGS